MEHKLAPKEAWSLRKDSDRPCKDLRAQLMKSTYESLESLLPRKIVDNETAPTRTTPEQHATNLLAAPTIAYIQKSNRDRRTRITYVAI